MPLIPPCGMILEQAIAHVEENALLEVTSNATRPRERFLGPCEC